jgi:hypothetical protein
MGRSSLEIAFTFSNTIKPGIAFSLGESPVRGVHSLYGEMVAPYPSKKILSWLEMASICLGFLLKKLQRVLIRVIESD